MALKARINDDIKAALLERRRFDADILRGLKAAILNEEVASGTRETGLSDSDVEKIIAREVKKRHESAALYQKGGRDELAENELAEVAILEAYLPQQLTDEEAVAYIDEAIQSVGAADAKAMGQVIGAVKVRAGSQIDGGRLAQLVKQQLSNK